MAHTPPPTPERVKLGSGLRFRFYLLVAMGVLFPSALVAGASFLRLRQLDGALLQGREAAARAVADHFDEQLAQDLQTLQRIAASWRAEVSDPEQAREVLRQSYRRFQFVGGVFLLDARGETVAEEPRRDRSVAPPASLPDVREVLRTGKPRVTGVVRHDGHERVYALVSVTDWQGKVAGAVGGLIDHSLARHSAILHHTLGSGTGRVDVVDGNGIVLASTDRARTYFPEECQSNLARLAREHRSLSSSCHGCHVAEGTLPWILAFVPLASAPWGIAILQPESEVLATANALPTGFPLYVAGMLFLAAVFAWGAVRSVTRPIGVLTGAAERIAGGRFEPPIPALGGDEIGRLGRSLEHMRTSLRDLIAYKARYQEELEQRVEERTAALASANDALREREEARAHLLRKVITAQEDERKRIARELHDDTSQSLAVLVMGLDTAIQSLRAGGPAPRLDEVKALAVHALDEVHRLIHDLRPSVLDDLGLFSAIRWYAERHLASRGISVRCEVSEPEPRLPPAWEIALFRAAQEAMNNIVRHASAESVLVQVNVDGRDLVIDVEDDGKGFDPASAPATDRAHWGLLGIQERAQILGGTARIDSAPGRGTRVEIRVPLPDAP